MKKVSKITSPGIISAFHVIGQKGMTINNQNLNDLPRVDDTLSY